MARPAEFDRNDVLERAMNQFWKTGYAATSITDLVNATNLKPGSLYGAFNNKRDLFLASLEFYAQRSLKRITDTLEQAQSPVKGVEAFFSRLCLDLEADDIGKSCLLVNSLLELSNEDDEIRSVVSGYLDAIEKNFVTALQQAQELGEIDAEAEIDELASFLMTSIWGLRVLSSKQPDKKKYQAVINNVLRVLYTPVH